MIRFDLTTLRIFVSVYNLKSLTKAAEQEHIASSAVSKRINDLETELGTPLFYRHPRGVSATPAGDALARHARVLFERVNDMAAELSTYAGGERGQVRIHAHSSAMHRFLPAEIASFSTRYPEVRIVVREETTPNVIQSMQDGVADIGVVAGHMTFPAGLTALGWREDRLVVLLPAGDPLLNEDAIPFAALADRALISLETGSSLQVLLTEAAQSLGMHLNNRLEVTTFGSAVAMAAAGLGVAVVPSWIADGADPRLAAVPLADPWARRRISVLVCTGARPNAAVQLMLDHLFAGKPYPMETSAVPNR